MRGPFHRRRLRRILLALLAEVDHPTFATLQRLSQVYAVAFTGHLDKLTDTGLVLKHFPTPNLPEYRLTESGLSFTLATLGLDEHPEAGR